MCVQAAGTMPSPTTTGSSKPEDVLEAQLDYVAHQLSGTLLEDTRSGPLLCPLFM